jgi:glycine/D-amino acid oxidase-like deaminating enzyme
VLVQREMERGRSPLVSIPPFRSRNPGDEPNVYIATGDSGAGLTHGTIAGMLLQDLILGLITLGRVCMIRRERVFVRP